MAKPMLGDHQWTNELSVVWVKGKLFSQLLMPATCFLGRFFSKLLLLWAASPAPVSDCFSEPPLLSVISSLLAIFRSSLPENISLIWDWFILVSRATFCRATKNDFVPDAEDHKPGTHLLLAKAGGLRRRDFMLQREALVSLAVFGFCRLSETFQFIVSTTVLAKNMQFSLKISSSYFLHGFGCWFWHTHTCAQVFLIGNGIQVNFIDSVVCIGMHIVLWKFKPCCPAILGKISSNYKCIHI